MTKVQLTPTDGAGGFEKETVSLVASLETALNVIPKENIFKTYSMNLQQKFMQECLKLFQYNYN